MRGSMRCRLSWAVAEVVGDVSRDNFLRGRITRALQSEREPRDRTGRDWAFC
ncbi:hypothetical protein QBC32DRAFT_351513 [Pseudoneurospora amorphoporcata]|uniref:Uncharacterized protein n=1 Tax=Pseudoneurospora amorphoporcata TaxID=241081 RepID=A0AAN6NMR8_9PEZI|nr:hypothetical protein QBC32DRAFT_351513 [Pseudoneurospora amorphoporcata]